MEDGVVAVFPRLGDQLFLGQSSISNEAVALAVAMFVDPGQHRFDIREKTTDDHTIARPFEIFAGQHHEQGYGPIPL
jgi:hypothetical protein